MTRCGSLSGRLKKLGRTMSDPEKGTVEELYEQAMHVHQPKHAQRIFSALVTATFANLSVSNRTKAERIVKSNLGYMAGYHDHETRCRVETLFRCVHPVLGPALKDPPSPVECFELGKQMGKSGKISDRWEQPIDDLHSDPQLLLLLQNVYQFREMLDFCYDEIEVLKRRLEKMKDADELVQNLEEENLKLRCTVKAQKQRP